MEVGDNPQNHQVYKENAKGNVKEIGDFEGCLQLSKTKFLGKMCWIDLILFLNERFKSIVYRKNAKTDPTRV